MVRAHLHTTQATPLRSAGRLLLLTRSHSHLLFGDHVTGLLSYQGLSCRCSYTAPKQAASREAAHPTAHAAGAAFSASIQHMCNGAHSSLLRRTCRTNRTSRTSRTSRVTCRRRSGACAQHQWRYRSSMRLCPWRRRWRRRPARPSPLAAALRTPRPLRPLHFECY